MPSTYLLDTFVATQPGEPFRLLPFGKVVHKGKEHFIDKKYAGRFTLPHFRPAIKLGSHENTTPAGGWITGLEVREDGLYAIPELNDSGNEAITKGSFRYQSPEILWDDQGLENPDTGALMRGPMIVGDAWLPYPHLGEKGALFSIEPVEAQETQVQEQQIMSNEETITMPRSLYDNFLALFKHEPEPKPEPPAEFEAVVAERDNYKAELEAMRTEREKATALSAVSKEFETEEFGAAFHSLGEAEGTIDMLAGMSKEQQEWVLTTLRALSAQIKESKLLGELGSEDPGVGDPVAQFHAAILAAQAEHKIGYDEALQKVSSERPELAEAYQKAVR